MRRDQNASPESDSTTNRVISVQSLVDAIPAGLFVSDARGAIIFSNRAAREIKGGALAENLCQPTGEFSFFRHDGTSYPAEDLPLSRAIQRGEVTRDQEILATDSHGMETPITVSGAPVRDASGMISGALVLFEISGQAGAGPFRPAAGPETDQLFLETVLKQMPSGVIIAEAPGGKVLLGNQRLEEIWRQPFRPAEGIEEYRALNGFHANGRPYASEEWPLARSIRSGELVQGEFITILRGDGTPGTILVRSSPVRDNEGRVVAGAMICADITERRRVEESVRESEEQFRATFEQAAVGMVHLNLQGRFLRVNRKLCEMLGYGQEELMRLSMADITSAEDQSADFPQSRRLVTGEIDTYSTEKRFQRKDGSIFWGNLTMSLARMPSGASYEIAVIQDITAVKQAEDERVELALEEAARERAEARARYLEALIQSAPDGILVVDKDGNVVAVNNAFASFSGVADRSTLLRPMADFQRYFDAFLPDGRPYPLQSWGVWQALHGQRVDAREVWIRMRGGGERLIQFTATPVPDERGNPVQAILLMREVTDLRRIGRQREVLTRIVELLRQGQDPDALLQTLTDQMLLLLGTEGLAVFLADVSKQELVLAAHRGLRPETVEFLDRVPLSAQRLLTRAFIDGEPQVVEDTSMLQAEWSGTATVADLEDARSLLVVPLLAADRPIGAISFIARSPRRFARDELETIGLVTELCGMALDNARLYQESWERADALEEEKRRRQEFTSVVAHDLRGPLSILKGYASMLLMKDQFRPETLARAPEIINTQVQRLNRLVQDLLDFSRLTEGQLGIMRERTELVAMAREMVEEVQVTTTQHQVVLETRDEAIVGMWDRDRVAQALTNLLANAIKYSPEGGEVRVVVQNTGGEAIVSVTDSGIGIAQDEISLLFQPYSRLYREKRAKGMGLGLYITKGIVEAHGGRIWVKSELMTGSTFTFSLPIQSPGARQP